MQNKMTTSSEWFIYEWDWSGKSDHVTLVTFAREVLAKAVLNGETLYCRS